MKEITVVVDPGHGGRDAGVLYEPYVKPGALYAEKALVLPIALHLAAYFSGYNGDDVSYKALLTRSSDRYAGVSYRVILANLVNADVFVSCHVNDMTNTVKPGSREGVSVLYFRTSDAGFDLADNVMTEILKTGLLKRFSDGLIPSGLDILRRTRMPAIVIELGFIRNYQDLEVITDEDCQARLAYAIFKGVHFWLTAKEREEGSEEL